MTKAELIRKIAKRSGVPDSETKAFFEIFLQKISSVLQPAQALRLKGFGYFQLKHAVIKTSPSESSNQIYADVIVYSPFNEEGQEELIFNIPSNLSDKTNYIDSYFSLSIGKPVIPLQGVRDADFFIPPTGFELKKLIESKADKLFSESEIITENVKGGEVLIYKTSAPEDQLTLNWDTNKIDGESSGNTIEGESEFGHIAWDFGEDLSKQIEEESILDTGAETSLLSAIDDELGEGEAEWDFTKTVEEENSNYSSVERKFEEDKFTTKQFDERVADEIKDFERVRSITSEVEPEPIKEKMGLTKSEIDLSWDFGDSEIILEDVHEENKNISGLDTNNFDEEIELNEGAAVSEPELSAEKETGDLQNKIAANKDYLNQTKTREYSYSKKRSPFIFVVAMITILGVAAFLFFFLTKMDFTKLTRNVFSASDNVTKKLPPQVIDRSFEVPVTYPYPPKTVKSNSSSEISPGAVNKGNANQQKSNLSSLLNQGNQNKSAVNDVKDNTSESSVKPIDVSGNFQKVKENIYQQNNNYFVQVSSWHSKSIAYSQAEKFKRRGYNSFVEKAELPGKGVWYRVRVGNFKDFNEAEKFLSKNR